MKCSLVKPYSPPIFDSDQRHLSLIAICIVQTVFMRYRRDYIKHGRSQQYLGSTTLLSSTELPDEPKNYSLGNLFCWYAINFICQSRENPSETQNVRICLLYTANIIIFTHEKLLIKLTLPHLALYPLQLSYTVAVTMRSFLSP